MEPDEPEKSRLVNRYNDLHALVKQNQPERVAAFSEYSKALYAYLFAYWTSPERINSKVTDALFEVKHAFQEKIFGEVEKQLWSEWNGYFLKTIQLADLEHTEKHIVITVGAEHRYWLENCLQSKP